MTSVEETPPPIIELGPANQTLPLKSVASLPCRAVGTPTPRVHWHKEGVLVRPGGRITMAINGTLFIDDLHANDSGLYTCIASSESGNTSWSAYLTVSTGASFHRTPDISALPQNPSKPRIVNITSDSVTLTWSPGHEGQSKIIGYTIEYYSSNLNTGWVVANTRILDDIYTVSVLRIETTLDPLFPDAYIPRRVSMIFSSRHFQFPFLCALFFESFRAAPCCRCWRGQLATLRCWVTVR